MLTPATMAEMHMLALGQVRDSIQVLYRNCMCVLQDSDTHIVYTVSLLVHRVSV